MQRFILRQNLIRFRRLLAEEADEKMRLTLQSMLRSTQRELALLEAKSSGVSSIASLKEHRSISEFRGEFEKSPHLYLVLDPRPGLHIVDVNDAYARATMIDRGGVCGEKMFNVFPDNPDDPTADGVSNLYDSLQTAAKSGRPHAMMVQRYDVRDPNGKFVERHWRPVNTPLLDERGRLIYLLHHVEDVTNEFLG